MQLRDRRDQVGQNRQNPWRRKQIALLPSFVEALTRWAINPDGPVVRLMTYGLQDLVSLSMLAAARRELESIRDDSHGQTKLAASRMLLELRYVYDNWREYVLVDPGETPSYDEHRYTWKPEEEHEFARASRALT